MWLFTRYGFYSVAAGDDNKLMVRSRMRQHLEALQARFPEKLGKLNIADSATNDYRFRLIVGRKAWEYVVVELAKEQTWSNFKGEVAKNRDHTESGYEAALHRVWGVLHELQPLSPSRKPFSGVFNPNLFYGGVDPAFDSELDDPLDYEDEALNAEEALDELKVKAHALGLTVEPSSLAEGYFQIRKDGEPLVSGLLHHEAWWYLDGYPKDLTRL